MITQDAQTAYAEMLDYLATLDTLAEAMRVLNTPGTTGEWHGIRHKLTVKLADLIGYYRTHALLATIKLDQCSVTEALIRT